MTLFDWLFYYTAVKILSVLVEMAFYHFSMSHTFGDKAQPKTSHDLLACVKQQVKFGEHTNITDQWITPFNEESL